MSRTSTVRPARTAPAGTTATTGRWTIDAGRSTLQVSVKVGLLATVRGRFAEVTGFVEITDDPARSTVSVTVPTASLTSGSHTMDTVLHNAGLVDSAKNPVIVFVSRAVRPGSVTGSWFLDGLLATDGDVLDVTFEMTEPEADPDGCMVFRASGSLSSKDAVRLLSHPGVDRLLGRSMGLNLTVVAVPE